jgi:hypothetical protein
MMRFRCSTLAITAAFLALGACGSGSGPSAGDAAREGQAADAAAPDSPSNDGPAVDAPAADTAGDLGPGDTDTGADAAGDRGAGPDGPPSVSDLEGAWYATGIPTPDGGLTRHQRLRFAGGTYYLIYNTVTAYCGEVGAFQVAGPEVTFTPDHVEGDAACDTTAARVEHVRWTDDGIAFDAAAGATTYRRARALPKLFVTFETHDGNIAGDPALPGTFAMDKADAICARSIARPDGASYRALLTDGLRRTSLPARDWVLASDTTYFQPDGVLNVLTTGADGASTQEHNGILSDGPSDYAWIASRPGTANTSTAACRSWTSNSRNDSAPLAYESAPFGYVSGMCDGPRPLICVTSPLPTSNGPDGGAPDGGVANDPVLQGAWTAPVGSIDAGGGRGGRQRITFDGDRYYLVTEASSSYCGEVGSFRATGASVAFMPQRVVGTGRCAIGVDRVEALAVGSNGITLSTAGSSESYTRAPDVAKVFATLEVHGGDFADDAVLAGTNAIDKADAFCNRSAARPDGKIYKAVLADGTRRSPSVGWPLQPATPYYDAGGLTGLFTTNASGLISGSAADGALVAGSQYLYLWTGMTYDDSTQTDVVATETCSGWTSGSASLLGAAANGSSAYTLASAVVGSCADITNGLICASQP